MVMRVVPSGVGTTAPRTPFEKSYSSFMALAGAHRAWCESPCAGNGGSAAPHLQSARPRQLLPQHAPQRLLERLALTAGVRAEGVVVHRAIAPPPRPRG